MGREAVTIDSMGAAKKKEKLGRYIAFLEEAEKLKSVRRTAWTAQGRRESTAEHSWRLALLAGVLADEFPGMDTSRMLMMCLIHDIGEIGAGDIPAVDRPDPAAKLRAEYQSARSVFSLLPEPLAGRMTDIWREYSAGATPEARLIKALDKAETILQHCQGDNPAGFDYRFNLSYGKEYFESDETLRAIRQLLNEKTERRMGKAPAGEPPRKTE